MFFVRSFIYSFVLVFRRLLAFVPSSFIHISLIFARALKSATISLHGMLFIYCFYLKMGEFSPSRAAQCLCIMYILFLRFMIVCVCVYGGGEGMGQKLIIHHTCLSYKQNY